MANVFTLTPGVDNFTGLAGDNNFFDFTSADLQSTDTITSGATGSFIDVLRSRPQARLPRASSPV
jgi:hypothetical protein